MKNAAHYVGKAGELRTVSELLLRGFNCSTLAVDDGIDIVLDNGKTIQVKTSNNSDKKGVDRIAFTSTTYRRGVKSTENRRMLADFLIVWLIQSNSFFIIPANEIVNTMCIAFSNKSKWNIYKDRWELLKEGGK